MSLDTPPYGFYTPSEEWVPVQEHDNLLFIDVEPTSHSGGASPPLGGGLLIRRPSYFFTASIP